jgi:cell filamentation protein
MWVGRWRTMFHTSTPVPTCCEITSGFATPLSLHSVSLDSPQFVSLSLNGGSSPATMTPPHLQAVHRKIFGDLYPWAGELRTVKIAKGASMFALPEHIAPYLTGVLSDLANEDRLRGLQRADFVTRLTHYFAELNAVHPFREGNGRTQRAFFGQISSEAGHPIDWTGLDPDSNIKASRESHLGDNGPLSELLDGLVAD